MEEQAIIKAYWFHFVYSQYKMLYEIIPISEYVDLTQPKPGPHVDGVIGSVENSKTS